MITNLFSDVAALLPNELSATLVSSTHTRIERIISYGQASSDGFWYDQDQHEWVVVLAGAATLQFDDGDVPLRPGDFVNIPAHKKHRVKWTTADEPTIWLAVFYA